jgi:hypothetical protein
VSDRKGIILAGAGGTRLHPMTRTPASLREAGLFFAAGRARAEALEKAAKSMRNSRYGACLAGRSRST